MKELTKILLESARLLRENRKAILAVVVDVRGSSYRLPGARMLITETGETFGTVSGGCLESDVLERARKVLQTGEATVLTYDTSENDDSVFSLNMGCSGVIRILLEPVEDGDFFRFVEKCFQTRKRGVVANLISTGVENNNENKFKIGSRLFFDESGFVSNISANKFSDELKTRLSADAARVLADGGSRCETYETENETTEFFLEIIKPPLNLVIFGAGYDAIPVAEFAKNLGWRVCVVDHRAAFAAPERFPAADEIFVLRAEDLGEKIAIDENSVAVIMTHNYAHDREILKLLLSRTPAYVGALGPKRRIETLLEELKNEGAVFDERALNKLYAPIGLDIGAASPEAIALSMVAEIEAVLADRNGGFLRARSGSIYNRMPK